MKNVSAVEKMAELMQQMEENSPRVTALQYCLKLVGNKLEEAEKRISELEAKCAALAAENAGLKTFGDKLSEMHNDLNGEGTGIQGRAEVACQQVALEAAMEEFDAIKTPATDDFLAEVRAQGIELFAIEWGGHDSPYGQDAYNFADKIRKGVQS